MAARGSKSLWVPGILLLCFSLVLGGCGQDDEPEADLTQALELEAYDFYFEDTDLIVSLGADVVLDFVNAGGTTHSFTVPDLDLDVQASSGDSTEVEFQAPDEAGTVDFYCKFHPDDMKGTLSIGGAEAPLEEDVDVDDDDNVDGTPVDNY